MSSMLPITTEIAAKLELISDKWSLLLLRDAFLGRTRFEQFVKSTGASRTLLTRRLNALLDGGLFLKQSVTKGGRRQEYRLTDMGKALFDAALLSWIWESKWSSRHKKGARSLHHLSCESMFDVKVACHHCGDEFDHRGIVWPKDDTLIQSQLSELSNHYAKRKLQGRSFTGDDSSLSRISEIIGDKWSMLILIASLLGVNRYDEFVRQLSIASNILSSRLKALALGGVFERRQYQDNPPRYEYVLSESGRGLSSLLLVIRQWAIDHVESSGGYEDPLNHTCCGKPLRLNLACRNCGIQPKLKDFLIE